MQKIVPHLWFDTQAKEAAEFYVSVFPNSSIKHASVLKDTPSGDTDFLTFELNGYEFMAISAGPVFQFNPSVSFMLNFDPAQDPSATENIDVMWEKLVEGGEILMPIQEYPFSKRYGWLKDKYGVSWQLILTDPDGEPRPFIMPSQLFVGDVYGKAESAIDFYTSVFKESKKGMVAYYGKDQETEKEDAVMFGEFQIQDQWFTAMDSALMHEFTFNEAVSYVVRCEDQAEIDYYWEKLSAVPEAEQCGWLKDKYGFSWQVTPVRMDEMMEQGTPAQIAAVTQSFLQMKKFDIAELEEAYKNAA